MTRAPDGRLIVITGRTRTGKSTLVRTLTRYARRLLVYDPKGHRLDYGHCHAVASSRSLVRTLQRVGAGRGRYRLIDGQGVAFDWFCRVVVWWSSLGPLTVVLEELAQVTDPGKARGAYGKLLNQGLGLGITIIAVTQRPTEIDTTVRSNASEFITFHMQRTEDRRLMAREMDIDQVLVDQLVPHRAIRVIPGAKPEFLGTR